MKNFSSPLTLIGMGFFVVERAGGGVNLLFSDRRSVVHSILSYNNNQHLIKAFIKYPVEVTETISLASGPVYLLVCWSLIDLLVHPFVNVFPNLRQNHAS